MLRVIRATTIFAAGAAIGAAAVAAHRVMQETGKPLQEAIAEVLAELERLIKELRINALQLIATEREANTSGHQDPKRFAESIAGQQ